MTHHRRCPLDGLPDEGCIVCQDLRDTEREAYARGWLDGANGRPAAP